MFRYLSFSYIHRIKSPVRRQKQWIWDKFNKPQVIQSAEERKEVPGWPAGRPFGADAHLGIPVAEEGSYEGAW